MLEMLDSDALTVSQPIGHFMTSLLLLQ